MNEIGTFFRDHGKVILIGLVGIALGVFLNNINRDRENKRFLALLTREHDNLINRRNTYPLNIEEEKQLDKLKTEIYIMKFKCLS